MLTALLRAHITAGQIEKAQADMAALEKQGGGGNLAQLYFGLGKLLEAEMKALKDKGDSAGLARRQQDYLKFLTALANAKSGQTYESLEWAGEQMLKIQNPRDAGKIFKRILETIGKDKEFLARTGATNLLLRTRIKYAERSAARKISRRPRSSSRSCSRSSRGRATRSSSRGCSSRTRPRPSRERGRWRSPTGRSWRCGSG